MTTKKKLIIAKRRITERMETLIDESTEYLDMNSEDWTEEHEEHLEVLLDVITDYRKLVEFIDFVLGGDFR